MLIEKGIVYFIPKINYVNLNPLTSIVLLLFILVIPFHYVPIISSQNWNEAGYYIDAAEDYGYDWSHLNYNTFATNHNPQQKINQHNIDDLEIKWIFPIPESQNNSLGGYNVAGQGEVSSPLLINGTVFFATAQGKIFALNAKTGNPIWIHTLDLNRQRDEQANLPIFVGKGITHVHGITYYDGQLYVPSPPCDIVILDSISGEITRRIRDICDVGESLGNTGQYKGPQSYGPTISKRNNVMIVSGGSVDETNRGGRGFFAGYNLTTGDLLWRFFVLPPSGGDSNWALIHADRGWIRGVRASDLPRESLLNDWGEAGKLGSQAGPNRGQWIIDEESGIVYVGTTHAAPASNATNRPGPNVFAGSILALNSTNGELVWWHQLVPHDLSDWDCNWNMILARIEFSSETKKIIFKGCKDGAMHAFDTIDGSLIWSFVPLTVKTCELCKLPDPNNPLQLKIPWANYPDNIPFLRNPAGRGGLVSDITIVHNTIYYGTYNFWDYVRVTNVPPHRPNSEGGQSLPLPFYLESNSTIYALNADSGTIKWTYTVEGSGYRFGLISSGKMLMFSSTDGKIRAIDSDSGKEIWSKYLGVGLLTSPIIGADIDNNMMILQSFGGQLTPNKQKISSALIAFHLPPNSQI